MRNVQGGQAEKGEGDNVSDLPPFVAFGNDEIAAAPALGKTVRCWMCGKAHRVEYADKVLPDGSKVPSTLMAFFKCGKQSYLCGIDGKEMRP